MSLATIELCRCDLESFVLRYLPHYFTRALQGFHRDLLNATTGVYEVSRGHGKSTCLFALMVHIAVFQWRRYVVCVSDTDTQATAFVRRVRDELDTNDIIHRDFGVLRGREWSEKSFITRTGVRFHARGSGSAIRGLVSGANRPDLLIVDDVENDEAVLTTERREKLWRWITAALWNVGGPDGCDRIVVGTPLHADCVLRKLSSQGWVAARYPAMVGDGPALWPEAFDAARLEEIRADIGSLSFSQEYLLEPMDDATRPFRSEWFRYVDEEPPQNWLRMMYVDPAIGQKKSSDWFVATVAAISPPGTPLEVRIIEQHQGKHSVSGQLATIERMADIHRPYQVGIESNAYQDALRQLSLERFIAARKFVTVLPRCNTAPKRVRIFKLSPRIESGVVTFHRSLSKLVQHMCDYPSVAHDDFEDSLAGVVEMAESIGRLSMV